MNETSNQVEMFLSIAALSNTDQGKVHEFLKRLSSNKKGGLNKGSAHPRAGFLKGAFKAEEIMPEETTNLTDSQTDNQSEL